ncbi:hypothetical protein EV359DRAFT_86197 [Lentinula novae-zelandiae]|nr:hypothetical protein EV359DRAFT_86197 [Lentinula novae-zelandiae]
MSDIMLKLRRQYDLPSVSSSLLLAPQELLPLQLLGFSNHGRANGSYNTSKLRSMPYERNTTVQNLLASNGTYVVPKLVVTQDNHFQLHALIRNHPLETNISLAQAYLGSDDTDSRVVAQLSTTQASGEQDHQELEPASPRTPNENQPQSSGSYAISPVPMSSMMEQPLPKKLWGEPWKQPIPLDFIPVFFDDERT